jgi:putative tryptophan/tyrosine transport system substrate-binding protein
MKLHSAYSGYRGEAVAKSLRRPLTDLRQLDILQSGPGLPAGDRMQFYRLNRREFITLLGSAAAAWPLAARAQQPTNVHLIGFLGTDTASNSVPWVDGLRAGLREFGYFEGKQIVFEFRYAEGRYERLDQLAAELLARKIDVLVTHSTPGGWAAKNATTVIPIVNASSGDMVASGLVTSLSRPCNMTGVTFFNPELCAKRLELLKEGFPQLKTVAVLFNPNNSISHENLQATDFAAKALNIELKQFIARDPADLEITFTAMANSRVDAVAVLEDPMLIVNAGIIGQLTLKQRLPSIGFKEIAQGGGLMSYGVNFPDMFRQAARLIDKIFKGSKPSDIPVERVTKFELIINLQTARALGLDVPPTLIARADEVIE